MSDNGISDDTEKLEPDFDDQTNIFNNPEAARIWWTELNDAIDGLYNLEKWKPFFIFIGWLRWVFLAFFVSLVIRVLFF